MSLSSNYLGSYTLNDSEFGTEVMVTVENGTRTITSNAIPNHATGDFPTTGNPNTITEQNKTWTFPLVPAWTGNQTWARETGVSINGVKIEPETAERISCKTGETYRIEAKQDTYNLGLDFNNAHVQPTGEYHYHGVSEAMVDTFDTNDSDLVHIGFAADGYLIYYAKTGYNTSYVLDTDKRTGTSCTYTARKTTDVIIDGTSPDGTYVSDWKYTNGAGNLDECNGTTIDGQYVYLLTDDYPFAGRCLNGEVTESSSRQGAPEQNGSTQTTNTQQGPQDGSAPTEALAACASKSVGSSCSFQAPDRQISGSCNATPNGELACMPNR